MVHKSKNNLTFKHQCAMNKANWHNESKFKLLTQPIDNSSTVPQTKYIVQYTEQKHQNYYHNES